MKASRERDKPTKDALELSTAEKKLVEKKHLMSADGEAQGKRSSILT